MQSGSKNPPWARSNVNANNMSGINPQIMDHSAMAMTQQGIMPFQQTQAVFNPNMMQPQGGMAVPMGGQMQMNQMSQGQMYAGNVVAYPTPRAMNPGMYQNAQGHGQNQNNSEQRVFTGTVTKTYNDFGFVDHDVFYQTSVCAKGVIPKLHDRVLVEANYNANMPFKWNATRVQVLPKSGNMQNKQPPVKSNSYNAVPPPNPNKQAANRREERPPRRDERKRTRTKSRSRSPRDRREPRVTRRDSPPRKRPVTHQPSPTVKYMVCVPRFPLDIHDLDVPSLTQRYTNLYIPSDFFSANICWGESFPPQSSLSLNNPCSFHIMGKGIESPEPNEAVLEPADADYRFSAKVMLLSMPSLETLYQKCGLTKVDDKDKDKRSPKSTFHPTRLIKFLVGHRGKGGENFAIGGPWSPSQDGENPQSDPSVLVKTAIRTCKALTGIDLSSCTQWYRMVEFYYWREGSGGKSRLECVVLYLPDVWSAQPTRLDWPSVQEQYKAACEREISKLDSPQPTQPQPESTEAEAPDKSIDLSEPSDTTINLDENEEEKKVEPTHYSKIDLKNIKVDQLRLELKARKAHYKGPKTQLVSRLAKLLRAEEEVMEIVDDEMEKKPVEQEVEKEPLEQKIEEKKDEKIDKEEKAVKTEKDEKKFEKDKASLKARYDIPNTPHLIVHPSTTAKAGKFCCNTATLTVLLDYRVTDNKEHSFELFVFAELFNEMLMRDFGFYIYKTLYTLPEKVDESDKSKDKTEKKDDKADKRDEKTEKKDEKIEKKDDKSEKKEDKVDKRDDKIDKREDRVDKKDDKDRKDDKRDSRRRERRDSRSDDERSGSPRRRVERGVDLPADPYLLLSLIYFDTSRCGYIMKKDLQNLFMSLGLQLSRSQIKNMLEKVCIKNSFSYKTLVQAIKEFSNNSDAIQDLPLDNVETAEVPLHIAEMEATIAAGNRDLLPLFISGNKTSESTSSGPIEIKDGGLVLYKSRLVDVGSMLAALARSEATRGRLENALSEARAVARTMRTAAAQTQAASRTSQSQLAELTARIGAAKERIGALTASSKIFHSTLKSIQGKVEAVINIKFEDDDVVEVINGPLKEEKEVKIDSTELRDVLNEDKLTDNEEKAKAEKSGDKETKDIVNLENMDIETKE